MRTRTRTLVDLSPLRASAAFARLWIGESISGIGAWLTLTAVGLQIYDITGSTFMVALVGGVSLIPMIAAGLWGGMLVDAVDRRTVAIVTAVVSWSSTIAILAVALWDVFAQSQGMRTDVWPLYLATTVNAVASTISMAARAAAIPRILPESLVSRATALNGLSFGVQLTIGPAIAGILVAGAGYPATYMIDALLFTAGFIGVIGLPRLPPLSEVARPGLASLVDGFRFLRNAPNIRMGFIVDIVAMVFGRPQVLFPALGAAVIGGGAVTVGFLSASMAVGTALAGLFSGPVGRIHRHGIAIGSSVIAFGACTVGFGLVIGAAQLGWFGAANADFRVDSVAWPAFALAVLLLAGTGASDEVSGIFRSTMILTAAPDEMRGRMQGIFTVAVTGGPRVGDFLTGILTTWLGLAAPALLGGIVIIVLTWWLVRASPKFRAYDGRRPSP
ncbi:MAG: MFS transporter [Microbacterium sp.]